MGYMLYEHIQLLLTLSSHMQLWQAQKLKQVCVFVLQCTYKNCEPAYSKQVCLAVHLHAILTTFMEHDLRVVLI